MDIDTGETIAEYDIYATSYLFLSFVSRDGSKLLLTEGHDGSYELWDLTDFEDGNAQIVGGADATHTYTNLARVAADFSPDSLQIVRAGEGAIEIFPTNMTPELHMRDVPPRVGTGSVFISYDDRWLLHWSNIPVLLDIQTNEVRLIESPQLEGYRPIGFTPSGAFIWQNTEKNIILWDFANNTLIEENQSTVGRIRRITFSSDGQFMASAMSGDDTIILWDAVNFVPLVTLEHDNSGSLVIAFSEDGERLVAFASLNNPYEPGEPSRVWAWDVNTVIQKEYISLDEAIDVLGYAIEPDAALELFNDSLLVMSGRTYTNNREFGINIWNLHEISEPQFINMRSRVLDASFSANGDLLMVSQNTVYTPYDSDTVLIYDTSSWERVYEIADKRLVQFSPSGRLIVSVSQAGVVSMFAANVDTP